MKIFLLCMCVLFVALCPLLLVAQQRWERNYGGTGNEFGSSARQTQDGGYVVTGRTSSFGNGYQIYLVKTNARGDTVWTRTYGGTNYDEGSSVQQTTDGGYIIAGGTSSFADTLGDAYLIKTNANGDTTWTRTYGGTAWDFGYSVQQTTDGGYIIAGATHSFGNGEQLYLVKTNASGVAQWTRAHGGTRYEEGRCVQQTSDGGYIVAGRNIDSLRGWQNYLVKTNSSGDTTWTKNYGGSSWDEGFSCQQTTDGGYIVAGYINVASVNDQVYLIKTNVSGDTIWTRRYGGASWDQGHAVQQTQDGGYIVAGYTGSFGNGYQVYLIKTNASGDTSWTRTYGGTATDNSYSVRQTSDGGYIIGGFTDSFGNGVQFYLIKTDANGSSGVEETEGVGGQRLEVRLTATPNPFTSFAVLPGHEAERFSLYDASGRQMGVFRGDRIGVGLAAGVYFIRADDRNVPPARVVKVR